MNALGGVAICVVFFAPMLTALLRRHPQRYAITILNLGGLALLVLVAVGTYVVHWDEMSPAGEGFALGALDMFIVGLACLMWLVALVWSVTAVRKE